MELIQLINSEMKHSAKKYTNRIFNGFDEFATTNAYNMYRHLNPKHAEDHGLHQLVFNVT